MVAPRPTPPRTGSEPPALRGAEILLGASALALLIILFALPWLQTAGLGHSGWTALPVLRWVIIVAALAALALMVTQATLPAPALPVSLSTISAVLSGLTTLLLIVRLLTTGATPEVGAYLGLVGAIAMVCGSFRSLRVEQGWTPGPERPIETVPLRGAGER